jgi:hypothetical protein
VLDVSPTISSTETLLDFEDIVWYPNPARSEIQIVFETKRVLPVTLSFLNILGENCILLPETTYLPGTGHIVLDVSGLAAGIYYVHLQSGNRHMTKKLMVMR